MWAFMPASANWTGSIPAAARRSTSGRQASGTAAGVPAVSAASKYRFANVTSSWPMNAGSAKKPWPSWLFTCVVTSRYMRLKHASPSVTGSAASIACMRAIAAATEVTGPSGAGIVADMAALYARHLLNQRRELSVNRCAPASGGIGPPPAD